MKKTRLLDTKNEIKLFDGSRMRHYLPEMKIFDMMIMIVHEYGAGYP